MALGGYLTSLDEKLKKNNFRSNINRDWIDQILLLSPKSESMEAFILLGV
jgi:hypothetical protein